MKKILSIILSVVILASVAAVSSVGVSAASLKAPSAQYYSDYYVQEHYVEFSSVSGATGYNITVYKPSGSVYSNIFYKSTTKNNVFYRSGGSYIYTNINKHIGSNGVYKIRVRGYYTKSGKRVYGPYSRTLYAAKSVTGVKAYRATVNGKKVFKMSWNKVSGAAGYNLVFAFVDKKHVKTQCSCSTNTLTYWGKMNGADIAKAKTVSVCIAPVYNHKPLFEGDMHTLKVK